MGLLYKKNFKYYVGDSFSNEGYTEFEKYATIDYIKTCLLECISNGAKIAMRDITTVEKNKIISDSQAFSSNANYKQITAIPNGIIISFSEFGFQSNFKVAVFEVDDSSLSDRFIYAVIVNDIGLKYVDFYHRGYNQASEKLNCPISGVNVNSANKNLQVCCYDNVVVLNFDVLSIKLFKYNITTKRIGVSISCQSYHNIISNSYYIQEFYNQRFEDSCVFVLNETKRNIQDIEMASMALDMNATAISLKNIDNVFVRSNAMIYEGSNSVICSDIVYNLKAYDGGFRLRNIMMPEIKDGDNYYVYLFDDLYVLG